jgi:2-polyprenyl-6-methoxyphenol hydroxylase-like FAD-dependent oxidoreductase
MPHPAFSHAVVAGASMAGLLAARVLSDHFDHVTVVERDRLPRRAEPRKGVPQGSHVHVLLPAGLAVLESLFPELTDALVEDRALRIDGGRDIAWFYDGGWRVRFESDLVLLAATRPLIEAHVLRRLRDLDNVTITEKTRVTAPVIQDGALARVGIEAPAGSQTLPACLLVDATGRGSAMPRWLAPSAGDVPTETIAAPLSYASCRFARAGRDAGWHALVVNGPAARRAGFCLAVEHGQFLVTLASFFDETSPVDMDAFMAFARSLPVPDLHEAIRDLAPATEIVRYRFPGSRRWRYERLGRLPAGLIAIGDAVCSFNPVYGQGMTVAALEALALGDALADARRRGQVDALFARRWYRAVARIVDVAWQGVAIEDYRFPELADSRPAAMRPLQWYMSHVHRATYADAAVTDRFYRVIGFLEPPSALFRPRTVAAVLRPRRRR